MFHSPLNCYRILCQSLVILLTVWIERHATIPFMGSDLRNLLWNSRFTPEWLLTASVEVPLVVNLLVLLTLTGGLYTLSKRFSPAPLFTTFFLFLVVLISVVFWIPTGISLWNLVIPGPSLISWIFAPLIFWSGVLYFWFHPKRAMFSKRKIQVLYLTLSVATLFLSLDRLLLSVVFTAFLPSIIQHLFEPNNIRHHS